ncbi:MAG: hypothetical protein ABIR77_03990, partial [Sphingomicrobium sp.]
AAAAERRVATTAVGPACAPADYLFAGLFDLAPQATIVHCGTRWSLMDYRAQPFGSGMGWVLYRRAGSSSIPLDRRAGLSSSPLNRRTGLPAPGVVASGPRPAL